MVGTISDDKRRELEAGGTTGSTLFAATAALGLAMVLAQYSASPVAPEGQGLRLGRTYGTVSRPLSLQINEVDLFKQINRIYDDLLRNQVELDDESKRVLYENLWDLYT